MGARVGRNMEVATVNRLLPVEMLERVFLLLCPRDLCSVVTVCRRWREVGEAPHLWVGLELRVYRSNLAIMPKVWTIRRLQRVRRIELGAVSGELLEALARHPGIRELHLTRCSMKFVKTDLLASLISKMEKVKLSGIKLTSEQLSTLCQHMIDSAELASLDLVDMALSSAQPKLLAQALSGLQVLGLYNTQLSHQQFSSLCLILRESTPMKCLTIRMVNLCTVSPSILAGTVWRLEEVNLYHTTLTPHQVSAVFLLLNKSSHIKSLNLTGNSLSSVDSNILSNTVSKLEKVALYNTKLTSQQVCALFRALQANTQMKSLNLGENDLSSVEPKLLARGISKLEMLDLYNTKLTAQQVSALFLVLATSTEMTSLECGGNDLSSVNPKLLSDTVSRLSKVSLCHARLTPQQGTSICSALKSNTGPRSLNLRHNDLSKIARSLFSL